MRNGILWIIQSFSFSGKNGVIRWKQRNKLLSNVAYKEEKRKKKGKEISQLTNENVMKKKIQ